MAGEDLIIKEAIKDPNPFFYAVKPFLELLANNWEIFTGGLFMLWFGLYLFDKFKKKP